MNDPLRRKLGKLEERLAVETGVDTMFRGAWPIEDQMQNALEKIDFYAMFFNRPDAPKYPATDREIRLFAAIAAYAELEEHGEAGTYEFPTGLILTLGEDSRGFLFIRSNRPVRLEDLPEYMNRYLERMDPAAQRERDIYLFQRREHSARQREAYAETYDQFWADIEKRVAEIEEVERLEQLLPKDGEGEGHG
jgi:hypothetical protein